MAKDPNYDRYAGIVSLPGADGKMPRPFRVDEDGNVIYRDEESAIGEQKTERLARERAQAGILEWDELDYRVNESSRPVVKPAMFVNMSDEPESTNWEMRDREGRVVNRPYGPRTGSSGGGRGGGGGGGWGSDSGNEKSAPKSYPKPKKKNN